MGKLEEHGREFAKIEQEPLGKSYSSIDYDAGTDLTLVLDEPLGLTGMPPSGCFHRLSSGFVGAMARSPDSPISRFALH